MKDIMSANNSKDAGKQQNMRLFDTLSKNQRNFVTAMLENPQFSKADAAAHIGLTADTVYRWGDEVDTCYEQELERVHGMALQTRRAALLKAIQVQIELMSSDDDSIKERASKNIIEWELGKAVSKTELSGKDGNELVIKVVYEDALGSDD